MPVPSGDLSAVIEQAVTEKLERLERRRFAATKALRRGPAQKVAVATRYIPAACDAPSTSATAGRCRYVDVQGRRCSERHRLEYHHRYPYGLGIDHSLRNVCLMCPAHNQYEAEHDYGRGRCRGIGRHGSAAISGSA